MSDSTSLSCIDNVQRALSNGCCKSADALTTKNKYGMLPLRTAIRSKASTEVIDALIRAAPSVAKSFGVSGKVSSSLDDQ